MSKRVPMKAETREKAGKGTARALRREGKTPAVIYGGKEAPVSITLDSHDLTIEHSKGHMFTTLYNIEAGGKEHLVLPRDIQLHPVRDDVMHVDFLRVTEKTKLVVSIPVNLINEDQCAALTDENGILNTVRYEVDILCKATNIPDQITVDLSDKQMNDAIKLSDAEMPEGSENALDRDVTIAVINEPKRAADLEEEVEGEDGEAAEGEEGETAEGEGEGESEAEAEE